MRTIEVNYSSFSASSMEQVIVKSWNNEHDNVAGNNVKLYLQQSGITGHAYTMGRDSVPITKEWLQYGAKDTTPKTDIVIGESRISLKVSPSAQLMSGGKDESMATFMNNIEYIEQSNHYEKTICDTIINNFKFFISGSIPGRISKALKENKNLDIINGDIAHKTIMNLINELFRINKKFKFNFIKEAMTGEKKFGKDSIGCCTHLLTVSKDGKKCHLSKSDDNDYINKIVDNTKISVRYKSTSIKRNNIKTGDYRYWSVLGLIVNNLNKDV